MRFMLLRRFSLISVDWLSSSSTLDATDEGMDATVERKLHQTIQRVTDQIPNLGYNTAIAAMMEYLNVVRAGGRTPSRQEVEPLIVMLAPFAPHIAEELYQRMGHNEGLFDSARWPSFDAAKAVEDTVEIGVQVNGKLRGRITVAADAEQESAVADALANENVARFIDGKTIRKQIYVPGKLLNLVVG